MNLASVMPLAAVPDTGGFASIFKIVFILVWFFLWLLFCQWVNGDTQYVRAMNRDLWNPVILFSGAIAIAVWLFLPWPGALFFVGWGLWLFIAASACAVYVILRNRHVDHAARVFTPAHIAKTIKNLGGKQEKVELAVERVPLKGADGKDLKPPTDPADIAPYETTQNLLFDALWRRATDVVLAGLAEQVKLFYKIDGVNTERLDLIARDNVEDVITLLKTAAGLDTDERRKPQFGTVTAKHPTSGGTRVEIEVKTSGTTHGERLELRIVTQEARLRLPDIGLTDKQRELFERIVKAPKGLVLVSGPKASGVTTTLYAALREHDAFMQNLHTLERQPSMELENITQNRHDPSRSDVTYARQLQSILRREPDVVMVSDCPDRETAHLAAKNAVDGKKLYIGMQARESFDALKQFVSYCADSDLAAAALLGISCQRLVRRLCVSCREAYKPDPALLKKANLPADKVEFFYRARTEPMLDKKGRPIICPNCQGSGYFGRVAVFEVLVADNTIRELIRNGQPAKVILKQCRKLGMRFLQETAFQLVVDGVTSMNEVIRGLRDEPAKAVVNDPAAQARKE
jgi:type II secretory ATPase GspE/PulE/Tfp pilus assembly ATPase PilB-like protein